MKPAVTAMTLLVTVWLQTGLLPAWRPGGVVPGLFLIVAYMLLAVWPDTETLAYIIAGSLLLDILAGSDFGLRTAFYAVFGLAVLALRQSGLELRRGEWGVLITLVATAVFEVSLLASLALARIGIRPAVVGRTIVSQLAANLILYIGIRLVAGRFLRPGGSAELQRVRGA